MRHFFRSTKRILALTLATLLTTALAACGASNPPAASTGTAAPDASAQTSAETAKTPETHKILVAYFSATGHTKAVAETLSKTLSADLFELVPQEPYTDADLDWHDKDSRCSKEHEDDSIRPTLQTIVSNLDDYDTILLGYPLWWGDAPLIVRPSWRAATLAARPSSPSAPPLPAASGTAASTWKPSHRVPPGRTGCAFPPIQTSRTWQIGPTACFEILT